MTLKNLCETLADAQKLNDDFCNVACATLQEKLGGCIVPGLYPGEAIEFGVTCFSLHELAAYLNAFAAFEIEVETCDAFKTYEDGYVDYSQSVDVLNVNLVSDTATFFINIELSKCEELRELIDDTDALIEALKNK